MNVNKKPRKCKVCNKQIKMKVKIIGNHGSHASGKTMTYSDEGVIFRLDDSRAVFCNDCWDKIIKYYKKTRKWYKLI